MTPNPFPIPVRAAPLAGPGSQPLDVGGAAEAATLDVMPMPREMNTFEMPRVPEHAERAALIGARDLLAGWLALIEGAAAAADSAPPALELTGVDPAVQAIANQVLGEGEVSIRVAGTPALHIQETVFAGLWRCCALDAQGRVQRDWLEAGAVPGAVRGAARAAAGNGLQPVAWPQGVMNAPALVAEIGASLVGMTPGRLATQINLSLLPLSAADRDALAAALPVGPVAMISRGFGNCHVTSTLVRDVWRVQYFNSMGTLILDTLEVVDMPEVAIAAAEDLADSRARLAELVQWMGESIDQADG